MKLESLPAQHKARGALGAVFQPPGILLVPGWIPPPALVRKEKPWEWSSTPRGRLTPAAEERLTPCVPAGSPPQRPSPQGRLVASPPAKHYGSRTGPILLPRPPIPCIEGHCPGVGWPAPEPQAGGQLKADLPLASHSLPRFPRTPIAPATLPFSVSILHQHTDREPRADNTFSMLPASPRGCPLNRKISSSSHQSTFSSFCSACCRTKQPRLRAERAVSNQPACQELSSHFHSPDLHQRWLNIELFFAA